MPKPIAILVVIAAAAGGYFVSVLLERVMTMPPGSLQALGIVLAVALPLFAIGITGLVGKRSQIGSNVLLQIMLFGVVVLMANYVAFKRQPVRWDLSRNSKYQLSPMTVNLLGTLQKPVQAIVDSGESPIHQDLSALLREYQYKSGKGKFEVEFVNPFSNITRAQEIQALYKLGRAESNVILDYGGKSKVLAIEEMADVQQDPMNPFSPPAVRSFKGEQVITSTLLELSEEKQAKLYILGGHGEPSLTGKDVHGFKAYAERQNMKVEALDFARIDTVPADATALMIFGPKIDYSERDVQMVRDFWDKNGRLFVLLNPDSKTPRLDGWLTEQGIHPRNDWVLRTARMPVREQNGDVSTRNLAMISPAGAFVPGSPVTKGLEEINTGFLGHTQSLEIDPAARQTQKINITPVVNSVEGFWGETEFGGEVTETPWFDTKKDRMGPFPLAVTAEKGAVQDPRVKVDTARMVVVGNAAFLTDQGLQVADIGIEFATNSLNWLLNRDKVVGIPPKAKEPMRLTIDDKKSTHLWSYIFLILPAGAAAVGATVWGRRRSDSPAAFVPLGVGILLFLVLRFALHWV